eukprot:gene16847-biopygen3817
MLRRRRCQEQEHTNPPQYVQFCSVLPCSVLPCPSCNQTDMRQYHSSTTSCQQPTAKKMQNGAEGAGNDDKMAPKAPGQ